MAIAFDSSSHTTAELQTITWSHVINSNSNGVLLVFINEEGTSGTTVSATYNGVSMTALPNSPFVPLTGNRKYWGFRLLSPAVGTHNIVVTNDIFIGEDIDCVGLAYTGVLQTGFPDSGMVGTSVIPTATPNLSFTTVADNCWLVGLSATAFSPSAGAGTTIRDISVGVADVVRGLDSGGPITPAGSASLNLTQTSGAARMVGVSMAPAAVPRVNGSFLLKMI